jgi:hypothetical protein
MAIGMHKKREQLNIGISYLLSHEGKAWWENTGIFIIRYYHKKTTI